MREIKFRGKRIDNNEWVYGSLIIQNKYYIVPEGWTGYPADIMDEVLPETVGQYIGLRDKNNKEIYRGDVVICVEMHDSNIFTAWESNGHPNPVAIPFIIEKDKDGVDWIYPLDLREHPNWWKVIGNIYDNPELKGDKK